MFCIYCGNKLPDNAIFCNKCGGRLSTSEQPSSSTKVTRQFPPDPSPSWQSSPDSQVDETLIGRPLSNPGLPSWQIQTGPPAQWTSPIESPSQLPLSSWSQALVSQPQQAMLQPEQSSPAWSASGMQLLLIRIFQPDLANNALFGIVLGAVVAAIGGAVIAGIFLAFAHAFVSQGMVQFNSAFDNETNIDILLGIIPLHSPLRESLQLFLVMHGVATGAQFSGIYAQSPIIGGFTFSRPLNGLLIIPALLLTFGGYIAACSDFHNRVQSSLLRGAAIAIPYTILLFIMLIIVNGSIPLDTYLLSQPVYSSSSLVASLSMDGYSLIAFGIIWGMLFGLLGASLKLARGHWRHMLFNYLQTNSRKEISASIIGALAAIGVGVSLSFLVLSCLLVYIIFFISDGFPAAGLLYFNSWQPVTLGVIAYMPLLALNMFFFSFGAPASVTTTCGVNNSFLASTCVYSTGTHTAVSIFSNALHLPTIYYSWVYALLAIPAICLFLGGRVSAYLSKSKGIGSSALQGALIALPFTLLMMLLTIIASVTFTISGQSRGSFGFSGLISYSLTAGVGAFDLFLWVLLVGAVFGALGGMYQASVIQSGVSVFLAILTLPFRMLSKPFSFVLDRLSGQPNLQQRSSARGFLYAAFLCTLLLIIVAGATGGLLISLNQTVTLDTNRLIICILAVVLIALPGLLLLMACASALSNDPLESQSSRSISKN